ncbi:MAG: type II secretion system secretin GspD [Myxococcales bacterium]|nr:type II secretion system secretin GspD [Myxococcales bacterium]
MMLILSSLFFSAWLSPAAPGTPVLLAQETPPAQPGKTTRPPVPNPQLLKTLRPNNPDKQPLGPGGRGTPAKPLISPRQITPPPEGALPSNVPTPVRPADMPPPKTGEPANKIRLPETDGAKAATAADKAPGKAEGAGPLEPARADKSKDKRCHPLPPGVRVRMNFNEAEVLEIVQWISEITCKNFIISDAIRGGKITVLSNTPITAEEAYRAFLSALNVNNMTVVETGRFLKLQMKRDAPKDTIPTYVDGEFNLGNLDLMVTRLIQLKYADANTINGTVKQLVSKDGDSYPYAPTNTLIISDVATNMKRVLDILDKLDTPQGQNELRVVQVKYAAAADVAKTLDEVFGEKARAAGAPGGSSRIQPIRSGGPATTPSGAPPGATPGAQAEASLEGEPTVLSKVIADERTNKLLLIANSRSFPQIMDLIDKIDVPVPGDGQIQVIYLEHANAEELSQTLTSLSQGTANRPKAAPSSPGGGSSKPPAGAPKTAAELFQGEVKITADKSTNSLVVVASQNDFRSLLKVVKQLDIARRQVFVEAVIMEVNIDTSRDTALAFHGGAAAELGGETIPLLFGTQYKVNGQNFNSINMLSALSMLGFVSGVRGPNLSSDASILGSITIPKFGVMLQALQTDSNVNVLSTPHIITSDNEEAEIKVGENIPIPAGYGGYGMGSSLAGLASMYTGTTGTTGTGLTGLGSGYGAYGGLSSLLGMGMGAINRQEVGLTLKVKPQINKGNVVRMELEVELTEVKDTSNPLGPTTTKRSAKTVVLPRDQETVVVGGLMREKLDIGETKVPVLGDIPVIGWFFKAKHNQKTKTNLLFFLTPYVVEGPEDFRTIFERKMDERREFLQQYYNTGPEYRAVVDYRRKHGPLADMRLHLLEEFSRIENGGAGSGREIVVTPKAPDDRAGSAPQADPAHGEGASDSTTPPPTETHGEPEHAPAETPPPERHIDVE